MVWEALGSMVAKAHIAPPHSIPPYPGCCIWGLDPPPPCAILKSQTTEVSNYVGKSMHQPICMSMRIQNRSARKQDAKNALIIAATAATFANDDNKAILGCVMSHVAAAIAWQFVSARLSASSK